MCGSTMTFSKNTRGSLKGRGRWNVPATDGKRNGCPQSQREVNFSCGSADRYIKGGRVLIYVENVQWDN